MTNTFIEKKVDEWKNCFTSAGYVVDFRETLREAIEHGKKHPDVDVEAVFAYEAGREDGRSGENPNGPTAALKYGEREYERGKKHGKELGAREVGCPPHNLIDFTVAGTWSASVPPPNKKCTKCLLEVRF